jgi:hypothetical protein
VNLQKKLVWFVWDVFAESRRGGCVPVSGVHDVNVDAGQHKVTVTGTVAADTLVKRLYKSGKQALLLQPHAAPPPAAEAAPAAAAPGDGAKDAAALAADKKPAVEPVKEPQAEKVPEKKPGQEAAVEKKPEAESQEEEAKPSVEAAAPEAKAHEPVAKEAAAAPVKEAAAGNDAGEPKKSEKLEDAGEAARPVVMAERTLSASPPNHMMYEEYDRYHYPPQPILSYHAAQPRASVSHYAPQSQTAYSMHQEPPMPGYPTQHQLPPPPRRAYSMEEPPQEQKQWSPSYLYMPYPHSASDSYYQDYYSPPGSHALPLQDSYRMFDDENPNACSVM